MRHRTFGSLSILNPKPYTLSPRYLRCWEVAEMVPEMGLRSKPRTLWNHIFRAPYCKKKNIYLYVYVCVYRYTHTNIIYTYVYVYIRL